MDDFMNKPVPGEINKSAVEHVLNFITVPFELSLDHYIEKYGLTTSDVNYLMHIHIENLIRHYDLELCDFKTYISIWETLMREKERERKAIWD